MKSSGLRISPWLVVGSAVILLAVVLVLAARNYSREKQYMSQLLQEKGVALIRAVEAGARTGMMRMRWGTDQVQVLLEQTAQMPGVMYMALIDSDGNVVAHSDTAEIGSVYSRRLNFEDIQLERWIIVEQADGRRAFEVYRQFRPARGRGFGPPGEGGHRMHRHGMMQGRFGNRQPPDSAFEQDLLILAGLDVTPFEEARRHDIRHTLVISGVLLLLGFGGFVSLFWAQNYRLARRSLQDTSAFANQVVTSLPVGLIATDRQGNIAFFNGAAEAITGIKAGKARGQAPQQVLSNLWDDLKNQLDSGRAVLEREMEVAFGVTKPVPVSVSASRIINEQGQLVGNIIILRDLAEIRRLQEEIRRKEKLAAIGGLAAGVAHEIRNPLSSIKGIASYFKSKFAGSKDDREAAGVMVQEVDRLNRVISELLEFARPSELRIKPTDMTQMVRHSIRLVEQDADLKNIDIDLRVPPDPVLTGIDPDRISQCLLNLYLNAIQAMADGGRLTIELTENPNGSVRLEVADTGAGIRAEDIEKIFDPYYTSKPTGTGLGLAIVHKIIESHRGRIQVASTPGQGTRFRITLPNLDIPTH
jgi:two-component system sensor histidine kinase HydH